VNRELFISKALRYGTC